MVNGPSIGPPSLSPAAGGWLANFPERDRITASILLDSLRISSGDEIRAALLRRVDDLVDSLPKPVMLLPIRDLSDIDPDWRVTLPAVYRDFPAHVNYGVSPGSEAIVSNTLRQVSQPRGNKSDILPSDAELELLRQRRCRTLLFVGDYAGSGMQAISYLRSWLRNSTIRSWRSFGWIKVHVLLFACSRFAARRLRASAVLDDLSFIEMAADFESAQWTAEERVLVEDVCVRYARPSLQRRGLSFGFGGHGGLFVMTHTVPNNLPAVMIQDRGPEGEPWNPLFPRRKFPPLLQVQMTGYRPRQELTLDLDTISDRRLAGAFEQGLQGKQRPYLMLLAAIAGNSHDTEAIAAELATSTLNVEDMARLVRVWGLIDERNHLTDQGWAALRRARMRPRKIVFALNENALPYYPIQLRRVGDV